MTFVTLKAKRVLPYFIIALIALILVITLASSFLVPYINSQKLAKEEYINMQEPLDPPPPAEEVTPEPPKEPQKYIKWVDFDISNTILEKAMNIDIKSQKENVKINWIELLSYLAAKYGGEFSRYKDKDLVAVTEKLKSGQKMEDIAKDMKHYSYYLEAYTAVLGEFVGQYSIETEVDGQKQWKENYGLKVFSPIARGYDFAHCDDFGNQRSYGYARKHQGHDLMGNVGAPVVAIESGYVEILGWNQYGGWRIGIRSFDKKRYYYYAHLRKDHPYNDLIKEGDQVKAGDVIGYLGMTGYSHKENVNNIKTPHLHVGMQLIFNDVQKDGVNQIWIDMYDIVKLLQKNRSVVYKDKEKKESYRKFDFLEPLLTGE